MFNSGSEVGVLLFFLFFFLEGFDTGVSGAFSPFHFHLLFKSFKKELKKESQVHELSECLVVINNEICGCFQIQIGIDRVGRNLNILEFLM